MSIRIRKFDPSTLKPSRIMICVGKRGSGKSYLMRDLLYHMPRPDFVLAMAPTDSTLIEFRKFLPESCIFDHYNQEKVEQTISVQKELIARNKVRKVLIILDDCLYKKGILETTAMRTIAYNGRHLHIGLILAAQYLVDLKPEFRTNVDYCFALKETTINNRQKLHKMLFGQFHKFDEFDRVMKACTENYSAIVSDATQSSTETTSTIFWYKANTDVPDYRLCRSVYWRLADRCGITDEQRREQAQKQFEAETAAAAAVTKQQAKAGGSNGAKILVVQTEDEHGQVVTSTA